MTTTNDPSAPTSEAGPSSEPSAATLEAGQSAPAPASTDGARPPVAAPKDSRWEWLWRGKALRQVEEPSGAGGLAHVEAMQRARLLREVAARTLSPVDPLRSGPGASAAVSLSRLAAYWLIRAGGVEGANLPEVLDSAAARELVAVTGEPERIEVLLRRAPERDAERSQVDAADEAALLRDFTDRLDARLDTQRRLRAKLYRQRGVRMVAVLVAFGMLVAGVVLVAGVALRQPDLAKGKPVKTSSVYGGFNASTHQVDGNPSEVMFHTNEEQNPWYEVDLGAPTFVGSLEIRNRRDCCSERAVPLVVEVSTDHIKWVEVNRRTEPFTTFHAKVGREARWIRVSSPKRTWLHLEKVAVHAK